MDFPVRLNASGRCGSQAPGQFPVVFQFLFPQAPVVPSHATGVVECGSGDVEETGQEACVRELPWGRSPGPDESLGS